MTTQQLRWYGVPEGEAKAIQAMPTCPVFDGTGIIGEEICDNCNGDGVEPPEFAAKYHKETP